MSIKFLATTLLLLLFLPQALSIDTCSNSDSTFYDGYLDPFISYASFSQSSSPSYMKFRNPYIGQSNRTQASVLFWFKVPSFSADGSMQSGTILDCQDSGVIALHSGVLSYALWTNIKGKTVSINSTQFVQNSERLKGWNHIGISLLNQSMRLFVNGVQVAELNQTVSELLAISTQCFLGNSQTLLDQFNGFLRHLVFGLTGLSQNQDLTTLLHSIILPFQSQNLNLVYVPLLYFSFNQEFSSTQTYYYTSVLSGSLSSSSQNLMIQTFNVQIQQSPEQEFVCYCTSDKASFLKLSSQLSIKKTLLASTFDLSGFNLQFQIYPMQSAPTGPIGDQTLLSISNQADIVVTNQASTIRVDTYSGNKISARTMFSLYTFRLSYWTQYQLVFTPTSLSLYIDGVLIQQQLVSISITTSQPYLLIAPSLSSLSYLLNTLTIQNTGSGSILYNQSFTYDSLIPALNANSISFSGTPTYQSSSSLCQNNQSTWVPLGSNLGGVCSENRKYAQFGSILSSSGEQGSMWGLLSSSQSIQTIELWFKDLGKQSQKAVIMENVMNGNSQLAQIGLIYQSQGDGSVSVTLKCNPNVNSMMDKSVNLQYGYVTKNWIHFACISDGFSLSGIAFNSISQQEYTNSIGNSYFSSQSPLNTTIGSSYDGSNQFFGLIRELKIWNTNKSFDSIRQNRFYSVIPSFFSQLRHYFMMNTGSNAYYLADSVSQTNQLQVSPLLYSPMAWKEDKDLVLCSIGFFYNGQCCQIIDFSTITLSMGFSSNNSQLQVSLSFPSGASQQFKKLVKANFSLSQVGNNFPVQLDFLSTLLPYKDTISYLFNISNQQSFNVSLYSLNGRAQSLTIKALLYSDQAQSYNTFVINGSINMTCPSLGLWITNEWQIDGIQTVSYAGQAQNLQVNALMQTTCYSQENSNETNYSIRSLTWSHNMTNKKFTDLFVLSNNNSLATAKSNIQSLLPNSNKYLTLTLTLIYSLTPTSKTTYTLSTSIQLFFTGTYLVNNGALTNGFLTSTQSITLLVGSQILIDLSQMAIADSFNSQSQIVDYSAICPLSLYQFNFDKYSSLCQFNSQGQFVLDTRNLNIISNYPYSFSLVAFVDGTSILNNYTLVANFYVDGYLQNSSAPCPLIQLPSSYQYNLSAADYLLLLPTFSLNCSGRVFSVLSINWTSSDALLNQSYSLMTYSDPLYKRVALLSNLNYQTVMAGLILNISLSVQLLQTIPAQSTPAPFQVSAQSLVKFSKNSLIAKAQLYSDISNQIVLNSNQIPFLNKYLGVDASSSFDPDNSTATLKYQWSCPVDCTSLITGSKSQILAINGLQRAKFALNPAKNYTFTVTVSSLDNPYKLPVNASVQLQFLDPNKNDSIVGSQLMSSSNCQNFSVNVGINQVVYQNSTYPKVLAFNKNNYIQNSWFNLSYSNVLLCKPNGNYTDQIIVLYLFDGLFSNQYLLQNNAPYLLFNSSSSIRIDNQTLLANLSTIQQFNFTAMTLDKYYQANIYMFTLRQNTSGQVELVTDQLFLYRSKVNLVASLSSSFQAQDVYSSLITLNANQSFDPEYIPGLAFNYSWICPNNSLVDICSSMKQSIFGVSYEQRVLAGLTQTGTNYTFGVRASDGERISNPGYTSILFSRNQTADYQKCLKLSPNQKIASGYQEMMNQTLFIEFNQSSLITLQMLAYSICSNLRIRLASGQWNLFQDGSLLNQTFGQVVTANNTDTVSLQPSVLSKIITPSSRYVLVYSLTFYMGNDSSTPLSLSQFVNVNLNRPDLTASILAPQIYLLNSSNTLSIIGSKSTDPANLPYQCIWTCPLFPLLCQNQPCDFSLNGIQIGTLIQPIALSYLFGNSYELTLTILSSDGTRSDSTSVNVYFADSSQSPFDKTGISECKIFQLPLYQSTSFDQAQMFSFSCPPQYTSLITQIQRDFIYELKSPGLIVGKDYQTLGDRIIVKPERVNYYQGISNMSVTITLRLNSLMNPLSQSFQVSTADSTLSIGKVFLSPSPFSGQYTSYSVSYSLNITGFDSSSHTGLSMVLRGYSSKYLAMQTIIPMKSFSSDTVNQNYNSVTFSQLESLLLDFFDQDLAFLGSIDLLYSQIQPLSFTLGSFSNQQFSLILNQIINRGVSYYQINPTAAAQFESDIRRLLQLSEMLTSNLVYGMSTYLKSNFTQTMLLYYYSNFFTLIDEFYPSIKTALSNQDRYNQEARNHIESSVLLTLANLIESGTDLKGYISSVIAIVQYIVNDFQSIISIGESMNYLVPSTLSLIDALQAQSSNLNPLKYNTTQIANQVSVITFTVESTIKATLIEGIPFTYSTQTSARVLYKIQKKYPSQLPLLFNSTLNNQSVTFQNEQYLSGINAQLIDVKWSINSNSSSPSQSLLNINLLDASNTVLSSSTQNTNQQTSICEMQLQVKQSLIASFKNADPTSLFTYSPFCSYYDSETGSWSTNGIIQLGYDDNTGVVTCQTQHLSQFTIDYIIIQKTLPEKVVEQNATQNISGEQNQSQSANNQSGTNSSVVQIPTYFKGNKQAYAIIVIAMLLLVFISISWSLIKMQKLLLKEREQGLRMSPKRSKCKQWRILFRILSPLGLFGIVTKKCYFVSALPIIFRTIFFWIHLFFISIIFSAVLSFDVTEINNTALFLVPFTVILILRPMLSALIMSLYISLKAHPENSQVRSPEKKEESLNSQDQLQNNPDGENQQMDEFQLRPVEGENSDRRVQQLICEDQNYNEVDPNQIEINLSYQKRQQNSSIIVKECSNEYEIDEDQEIEVPQQNIEGKLDQDQEIGFQSVNQLNRSKLNQSHKYKANQKQVEDEEGKYDELQSESTEHKQDSAQENKNSKTKQNDYLDSDRQREEGVTDTISGLKTPKRLQADPNFNNNEFELEMNSEGNHRDSKTKLKNGPERSETINDKIEFDLHQKINTNQSFLGQTRNKVLMITSGALLISVMIASVVLMGYLKHEIDVNIWVGFTLGLFGLNLLVIDPLGIGIYTLIIEKALRNSDSLCYQIVSVALVGNGDVANVWETREFELENND